MFMLHTELKQCLYLYFSQYGRILDIVALKTQKMRGQAFIVFADIESSMRALHHSNHSKLLGQPMHVAYAKTKSKAHLTHIGRVDAAASIQRYAQRTNAHKHATHNDDDDKDNNTNTNANAKGNVRVIIEGVPPNTEESELLLYLTKMDGFMTLRSPRHRPWVSHAYFTAQPQAIACIHRLQGMRLRNSAALRFSLDI